MNQNNVKTTTNSIITENSLSCVCSSLVLEYIPLEMNIQNTALKIPGKFLGTELV